MTLFGLALLLMPLGQPWVNASYDALFRFGGHEITNRVVLLLMDNDSYAEYQQIRGPGYRWDRGLHTRLLNRLADDGCPLVVFDVFFRSRGDPFTDEALAEAMRRQSRIVLMAEQVDVTNPNVIGLRPALPTEPFLSAVGTNWGIARLAPDSDAVVRRHWPFPDAELFPSLPRVAARLAGAQISPKAQERWLRYYGPSGAWMSLGYRFALTQPRDFFRDKLVFVGSRPKTTLPDDEREDEFRTPYTRLTGEASGGLEILVTMFLNLVNQDWLKRPAGWVEALLVVLIGSVLGGTLCHLQRASVCAMTALISIVMTVAAILVYHFSNIWFPWLVIVGGQIPLALAWGLIVNRRGTVAAQLTRTDVIGEVASSGSDQMTTQLHIGGVPEITDYKLYDPPIGGGAYGTVWLARNAVGQWQALKVVHQAKFGKDLKPYEREFRGIERYKPISDKHPGLLRIEYVSMKRAAGFFYYVMELGDATHAGWQDDPRTYRVLDLAVVRDRSPGNRLHPAEAVRIVTALAEALEFLHGRGLTHRDIKPSNVIFVQNQPKLADIGLVANIPNEGQILTWVGTPAFMPPPPEPAGTVQADIYALGMVFYVITTGRSPVRFSDLQDNLIPALEGSALRRVSPVILKAIHPDRTERYKKASELHRDLLELRDSLRDVGNDE